MAIKRAFLLLTLLVIIGVSAFMFLRHKSSDPAARLAAEREVYSRLLLEQKNADIKVQQIVEYTNSGQLQGNIPIDSAGLSASFNIGEFPDLQRETWIDFQEQNKVSYPIEDYLPSTVNMLLIDPVNSEQLYWWLSYSRVGFNSSLTQALVLVGDCRGESCYDSTSTSMYSQGYYVFLQKENEEWTIQGQQDSWFIEAPSP